MESLAPVRRKSIDSLYPRICEAARSGLSNSEIAQYVGITSTKLSRRLKSDDELLLMVEEARSAGPAKFVEAAMVKAACGHTYEERSIKLDAEGTVIEQSVQEKYAKPSPEAMKFFLKNRGENWRDKVEIDTTQEIKIIFDPLLANV